MRILLSLAVGMLLGVAAPATASAATLYVSPNGSGSTCSASSPCSAWDVALDKAAPGDHVQMAAGNYGNQPLTRDSADPAPIVFEPAPGGDRVQAGTILIRADYVTLRGIDAGYLLPCSGSGTSTSCNPGVKNAVTGVTVEDFKSREGMYGHGLDHVTFRNGDMGPQTDGSDLVQIGMGFPSRYVTFDRMYFHDNYPLGDFAATPHTDCIQAFGIDHFTISDSRFERCTNDDFLASTDSGAQWSSLTLVNNWFGKVFRCDSGHCRTVNELQQGYLSVYVGSNLTQGNNRIEGNYFEQALHQHTQAWAGTSTTLIRGNVGSNDGCVAYATFEANRWATGSPRCGATDTVSAVGPGDWGGPTPSPTPTPTPPPTIPTIPPLPVPPAPPVSNPSPTNLVGAWGFDEASGTAARDRSGYGNDGTISGARRVTGKFGGALRFDGRNDYVTVPDAAQLDLRNAITMEAWVRPGSAGGVWRSIAIKEHGENLDYGLYSNAGAEGAAGYLYTDRESKVANASALARDRWSHVAMTWDGATMRLYVNGALIKSSPMRGSLATSAGALRIGGNALWGEFFDGTIDELRIYARALPQAELQGDAAQAVASLKLTSRAHANRKRKGHRHASKHKRTKLRVHRLSARADHYWHR